MILFLYGMTSILTLAFPKLLRGQRRWVSLFLPCGACLAVSSVRTALGDGWCNNAFISFFAAEIHWVKI